MSEKELAKWLTDLAACYDCEPKKAAIARYLRILAGWKLGPAQWTKLGDLAVLRLTRRFPMPGELHEIAQELMEEEEPRANSERLARMREEWEGRDRGADDPLGEGQP